VWYFSLACVLHEVHVERLTSRQTVWLVSLGFIAPNPAFMHHGNSEPWILSEIYSAVYANWTTSRWRFDTLASCDRLVLTWRAIIGHWLRRRDPRSARMFCDSWPWPLTLWSQNEWVSLTHRGTFLYQVWWSWLHEFLRYRMEKNRQSDETRAQPGCFVTCDLDLWPYDPKMNGFPWLIVERFCIKFGDPGYMSFWDTVWKNRQSDTQTNGGKTLPRDCVGVLIIVPIILR